MFFEKDPYKREGRQDRRILPAEYEKKVLIKRILPVTSINIPEGYVEKNVEDVNSL